MICTDYVVEGLKSLRRGVYNAHRVVEDSLGPSSCDQPRQSSTHKEEVCNQDLYRKQYLMGIW